MLHVCSMCDKKFVFKRELLEHEKEMHVSIAEKFRRAGSLLDEWEMPRGPMMYATNVEYQSPEDQAIMNTLMQDLEAHMRRVMRRQQA